MKKNILFLATILLGVILSAQTNEFLDSKDELLETFKNQAESYYNVQDYDNALSAYEKALELQKEIFSENSLEVADTYSWIGYIYYLKSAFDNAIKYSEKSLNLYIKIIGDNTKTATEYNLIANIFFSNNNFETAIEYYKKALYIRVDILNECTDSVIIVYKNISRAYIEKEDYENALIYYEKAFDVQKQLNGEFHKNLVETLNDISSVCLEIKNYEMLLDCQKKIVDIYTINEPENATEYRAMGEAYYFTKDHNSAINCFENALELDLNNYGSNNIDVLRDYNNLSVEYEQKNDFSKSIEYKENAIQIEKILYGEESLEVANRFNDIGLIYNIQGNLNSAIINYEKALKIREKRLGKDNKDVANLYSCIGSCFYNMGNFDNSYFYLNTALSIYETIGSSDLEIAKILINIGGIFEEKQDYDNALFFYKRAASIFQKYGTVNYDLAACYQYIGCVLLEKNDIAEGIEYYTKSVEIRDIIFQNYSPPAVGGDFYDYIGHATCFLIIGKYDSALEFYKRAEKASIQNGLFVRLPTIYYNMAVCFKFLNDYDSCIEYNKKFNEQCKKNTAYRIIISNLKEILINNILTSYPDIIRETLTLATDTVERARLDLSSLKDDILHQSLPIYYYGVQFESEQKNLKKAFEYSESLRSRGFLDQIGTEAALKLDGVTDEEREQIHSLTSEITAARKTIEAENSKIIDERDEKRLSEAGKNLSDAEKSLASLDKKIGKRIPAYSQLRNPVPVTTSAAQKWCGKKRVVLEYVLWNPELTDNKDAKIKSYCLVLTDKKITAVELDGEYDYTKAINKLRSGITGLKRESQFEGTRNELYEKLIAPVLPYVGGAKELVIVPDGNLSFLPFDVLRKDESSKMLGDKYAIALSPSVSVSVLCDKYSVSARKMLAFGGAWYDTSLSPDEQRQSFTDGTRGVNRGSVQTDFALDDMNEKQLAYTKRDIQQNGPADYFAQKKLVWQNLPGTLTELGSISGLFKQDDFSEITQEKAAEYNVKQLSQQGELSKYGILHFACHGYFDKSLAEMSSVLFSEVSGKLSDSSQDDGYLTIGEAAVLNLNADIVCLSACETGLGEIKAGDGIVGLSRAFMVAGAKHVGASLWCVDDTATAKFMSSMYKKVTKGMDYITAYQKTKAEFRKDEDFSHPYYWSAFVLYE